MLSSKVLKEAKEALQEHTQSQLKTQTPEDMLLLLLSMMMGLGRVLR
jgi:hypothetical protein